MVDRKVAVTWLVAFILLFFAQLYAGVSVMGPDGLTTVPATTVADVLVAVFRSAIVASIATLILWSLGKAAHVVGLMRG